MKREDSSKTVWKHNTGIGEEVCLVRQIEANIRPKFVGSVQVLPGIAKERRLEFTHLTDAEAHLERMTTLVNTWRAAQEETP